MRHASFDPRCERCFMKPVLCLCSALSRRPTRHHVRVIVHDVELMKSTNSGRLLPLLLEQAELVPYGGPYLPLVVSSSPPLPPGQTAPLPSSSSGSLGPAGTRPLVLFPQNGVPYLHDVVNADQNPTPRTLIVLDGTWHQANRLRKRFLTAGIPFVRLPDDTRSSTYQLRTGHFEGSLSTLEAAARALAILEGDMGSPTGVEAHLLDGFRRMVDRTLWLRGNLDGSAVYGGLPSGITRHGINQRQQMTTTKRSDLGVDDPQR